MSAAMYVPFAVLLMPHWLGSLTADGVMLAGHLLMPPAMVIVMLARRDEYTAAHHAPVRD